MKFYILYENVWQLCAGGGDRKNGRRREEKEMGRGGRKVIPGEERDRHPGSSRHVKDENP